MSALNTKRGKLVIATNTDGQTTNLDCRYRYSNDIVNGTCTYERDGVQVGIACPYASDQPYPKHCPLAYFDELEERKVTL